MPLRRLAAACLTCASLAIGAPSVHAASTPIASVNGENISSDAVEVLGSAYIADLRKKYGQRYTAEIEHDALRQVLEQIITATLLRQEAEKRGITATEAEIDTAITLNDYFHLPDGGVDWPKYQRYKSDPHSNYPQVAANLRRLVIADKLTLSIKAKLAESAPEDSVHQAYTRHFTRRTLDAVVIRPDTIITDPAPTEEELARLYLRRRDAFRTTQVTLSAFALRRADFAKNMKLTSEDLASYYRAHADAFTNDSTGVLRPFDQVRDAIRDRLAYERAEEAAVQGGRALRAALERGLSADEAMRTAGVSTQVTPATVLVGITQPGPLFPDSVIARAAGAQTGAVLGPVMLGLGPVVYRVDQRTAGFLAPIESLRDTLTGEFRRAQDEARRAQVEAHYHANIQKWMSTERVNLQYAVVKQLPTDPAPPVTAAAVRAYYLDHRDDFRTAEQVRAAHILLPVPPESSPAVDSTLKQRADSLRRAIVAGADFVTLAKAFSGDPGSAARGGDLGYFGRGRMVQPFEDAAFSTPLGQVSAPFRTEFGWHILQVIDKRAAQDPTLEEVRPRIESELRTNAVDAALAARANRILQQSTTARAFARLVAPYGGVRESGSFAIGDPLPVVGKIVEVDRVLPTMRPGDAAPKAYRVAGGYLVFRLLERQPPAPLPLPSVYPQVSRDVFRGLQQEQAWRRATELRDRVNAGGAFFTIAARFGELHHSENVKRGDEIAGLGRLTAAQEDTLADVPAGGACTLTLSYGVAVVGVSKLAPPDDLAYQQEKTDFRYTLAGEKYDVWLVDLRRAANVHYFSK